jgi:hypothetical protein
MVYLLQVYTLAIVMVLSVLGSVGSPGNPIATKPHLSLRRQFVAHFVQQSFGGGCENA